MIIKSINLINYKNIKQAELVLNEGINCFVGNNGVGKTNLLDAIYYLSYCKSCFNSVDSQLINHDEKFFVIQGEYDRLDYQENIYAGFKVNEKKQFKRNKKDYQRLSDHIGLLPLVLISPSDEKLIIEGGEQRRRYIDSVISQFDKQYMEHILRYNRAIVQRNSLLKSLKGNRSNLRSMLEVWDAQLILSGTVIYEKRMEFIKHLLPVFQEYYSYISDDKEVVDLIYNSHFDDGDFEEQLIRNHERDLILGHTSRGVHRDDITLLLNGYPIRKMGSQGQIKTFFIALKLAQYDFLKKNCNFSPLLLLDDMFDKLDSKRGSKLVNLVSEDLFKQIFITDTQYDRLLDVVKQTGKEYSFFIVDNGEIVEKK